MDGGKCHAREKRTAVLRWAMVLIAVSTILGGTSCTSSQSQSRTPLATASIPYSHPFERHGRAPTPSTAPDIFVNGPEIRTRMLELINGASDYILINSFIVVHDPLSVTVLEALKQKHKAGVRIYVFADSSSRFMIPRESGFPYLKRAGIPCVEFNPMRAYKLVAAPVMLPRDHRKFWIVDGKFLFLGGANIIDNSLAAPEEGGSHDLMVEVESAEAIRQMIGSFVEAWNASSSSKLKREWFSIPESSEADSRCWVFDQGETGPVGDKVIVEMIDGLFATAQREVWLVQPYTIVNKRLLDWISQLSKKSVAVNLVLSGDFRSQRFRKASYFGIKDLLKAGAAVWIYDPDKGPLHAKVIVVDGRWVSVGSANLNLRSYSLSKETNLVTDDPQTAAEVNRFLEQVRSDCRSVGRREARKYRWPKYSLSWLLMQAGG